tara:strand:- start:621 stop:1025 length:405 start_codon:yes stop_codon:yes gene_type:complete
MDGFMNEMAIWNGMSSAFISNAIFFAACAFLIWVGFRFTSRIYYDGDVNLLGKIFTTLFCLSIVLFTLGIMVQGQNIALGYSNAFSALSEVQDISSNAENFISMADGKLGPVQWIFLGSVVVMQLTQIWVKKPE